MRPCRPSKTSRIQPPLGTRSCHPDKKATSTWHRGSDPCRGSKTPSTTAPRRRLSTRSLAAAARGRSGRPSLWGPAGIAGSARTPPRIHGRSSRRPGTPALSRPGPTRSRPIRRCYTRPVLEHRERRRSIARQPWEGSRCSRGSSEPSREPERQPRDRSSSHRRRPKGGVYPGPEPMGRGLLVCRARPPAPSGGPLTCRPR